jgi:hypothetical protein
MCISHLCSSQTGRNALQFATINGHTSTVALLNSRMGGSGRADGQPAVSSGVETVAESAPASMTDS